MGDATAFAAAFLAGAFLADAFFADPRFAPPFATGAFFAAFLAVPFFFAFSAAIGALPFSRRYERLCLITTESAPERDARFPRAAWRGRARRARATRGRSRRATRPRARRRSSARCRSDLRPQR